MSPIESSFHERIQVAVLRFQRRFPFLAALALRAPIELSEEIPTACANGLRILFNPQFGAGLNAEELEFMLAHEELHMALRHSLRIGGREPWLFNVAAAIVVNGIPASTGMQLLEGTLRVESLEDSAVEEIYAILRHGRGSRFASVVLPSEEDPDSGQSIDVLPFPTKATEVERVAAQQQW